ncbi:MAG: hypothetical protein GY750_16775 [Lentisphaerae bacterium]|nr:hypothetical protein [Lentisphaerota bacterium]MCP4103051.1 hypothetical protein [Lentisphaerota bacterium]
MRLRKGLQRLVGQKDRVLNRKYNSKFHHADNNNINLDVPFVFQGHINLCVDACLYMMKLYFNDNKYRDYLDKDLIRLPNQLSSYRIRNNPRGILTGLDTSDAIRTKGEELDLELSCRCFPEDDFRDQLYHILCKNGPVTAFFKLHGVLIKGIIDDTIIVHDSWHGGNMVYKVDDFCKKLAESEYYFKHLGNVKKNHMEDDENASEVYRLKCLILDSVDSYLTNYKHKKNRGFLTYHGESGSLRMITFSVAILYMNSADQIMFEVEDLINKRGKYAEFSGKIRIENSSGLSYVLHGFMCFFDKIPHPKDPVLQKVKLLFFHSAPKAFEEDWVFCHRRRISDVLGTYHVWG